MAILDLYSNRRKRELREVPDVFIYDQLPPATSNPDCIHHPRCDRPKVQQFGLLDGSGRFRQISWLEDWSVTVSERGTYRVHHKVPR